MLMEEGDLDFKRYSLTFTSEEYLQPPNRFGENLVDGDGVSPV
jgi:hypothetical protein